MKTFLAVILAASALAVWQPNAGAQTASSEIEERVIERLSYRYQVPKTVTRQLREELGDWEPVVMTLAVSQRAAETPDHILALKGSGMGWGQIMDLYTVDGNEVREEIVAVKREIREWENILP